MKVSITWLEELVHIPEQVLDLPERLSMAGFEVESYKDLSEQAKGVVLGYVVSTSKHPNADKLTVCQVDIGQPKPLNIVCGALNVRPGIHVAVAKVGAVLTAKGIKIKSSELRGVLSEGMICSLEEIGLSSNSEGIAELDQYFDLAPALGTSVSGILGLNDKILDLAITANRPDGMSMVGIAREVSALTEGKLNLPEVKSIVDFESHQFLSERESILFNDLLYSISLIDNLDNTLATPIDIKNRLINAGINCINLIVDINNYVMLEQGQPMHAFDADALERIAGRQITRNDFGIRYAQDKEVFIALDGEEHILSSTCLLITCTNIPIAIAGIIGSKDSSVNINTKSIWLESAIFPPKDIRNGSRIVGIRTEASSRYEKGINRENVLHSSARVVEILNDLREIKLLGAWYQNNKIDNLKEIHLKKSTINKVLGPLIQSNKDILPVHKLASTQSNECRYIDNSQIEKILSSIGCKYIYNDHCWNVVVHPSRSNDLTREIDLIEEIARLTGYDKFGSKLPDPIKPGILNRKQMAEKDLRKVLIGNGLQEVTSMSLVSAEATKNAGIAISNPLLSETSQLRVNLWHEHIKICQRNLKSSQNGCWLFEIGNVFRRKEAEILEVKILGGLISGHRSLEIWSTNGKYNNLNYFQARGVLTNTFNYFRIKIIDKVLEDNELLHPGRSSSLYLEGNEIGYFGELHPSYSKQYDLPKESYMFEIELEPLLNSATRDNNWTVSYRPFATVPAIERDIALIVDKTILSSEIIQIIRKSGKPLLENVTLIDRFEGGKLDNNKCSQAFRITFRGKTTLTDKDIEPIQEKIISQLRNKFNAELRC